MAMAHSAQTPGLRPGAPSGAEPSIPAAGPRHPDTGWIWVGGLALLVLAVHLLASHLYNYFRDEFYYLACSRHLAWGYVDHPPVADALLWLNLRVLGDSLPALRLLPALANALLVVLAGVIARMLGGRAYAQALAALSVAAAPVYLGTAATYSMNSFEQLFWAFNMVVLVRILKGGAPRLWLVSGLLAGVGIMTKNSTLFFSLGTLAALLFTPARRHLRTPWPWLGTALAVALFLPNVVWQAQHGWPTLAFLRNAAHYKNFPVTPGAFLASQAFMIQPVNVVLLLGGLWFYLSSRDGARWRALGWQYLLFLLLFMAMKAKDYYVAPAYPAVLAAGAVAFEGVVLGRGESASRAPAWPASAWRRALLVALPALVAVGGAVVAPLARPLLPVEAYIRYAHTLGFGGTQNERMRQGVLPQYFADMFGWEPMVAEISRAFHALPPEDQRRCGIYGSNYGEAGAVDFYGPRYGLPSAMSGHNSYFLWGPTPGRWDVLLTVGMSREDVLQSFSEVTEVGRVHSEYAMPYENDLPIYLARKPKADARTVWPGTRVYI